ncbi:MAG: hypothetical protein LDL24_03810, partial [Treponema sp.]|nr:hypothetical protein [Treponema sp.]
MKSQPVLAGTAPGQLPIQGASEPEIRELAKLPLDELKALARKTADAVHGSKVLLRGLIEVTNYCAMDCLYCGIRRSNGNVVRYRLSHEELSETIRAGRR